MAFYTPEIGDQLPKKGGALRRFFGRSFLRIWGWKIEGNFPNLPKFVHIVGPHTSNWDFPVGVYARMAMGLDMKFMGKEALFTGIQGVIMRRMGGIPVSLHRGLGETDRLAEEIKKNDKYILTITPEGSRFIRTTWRTGFYYIAHKAGIPILPVYFDFKKKIVGYGEPIIPGGDINLDMKIVNDFYRGKNAKFPEKFRLHMTKHPITDAELPDLLPDFTREEWEPNEENSTGKLPEGT